MQALRKGCRGNDVVDLQKALGITIDGVFGTATETAVKKFQKENGLTVDGIVGAMTWLKLKERNLPQNNVAQPSPYKKSTRNIKYIAIHCAATPEGKDFTVDDITKWHKQRGFTTIGYHYVIYRDGSIHVGRDVNKAGAHVENYNSNSIGICYIGGCTKDGKKAKDTRTPAQKNALLELLKALRKLYPNAKIQGHRDFPNVKKACPSFDAKSEYKNI